MPTPSSFISWLTPAKRRTSSKDYSLQMVWPFLIRKSIGSFFITISSILAPMFQELTVLTCLGWQRQLSHLDSPFSEEEVQAVIKAAPREKAPRPDGFIGLFFSECWNIIKEDLMGAIHHFYSMNHQELHLLNQAFVVLVPKKEDPQSVSDFGPISLTHSFSKIISKILASRLGPELHHLISINQTIFIKKRVIHDNFVFVQQVIKDLHK
jgi:hypothetical protein